MQLISFRGTSNDHLVVKLKNRDREEKSALAGTLQVIGEVDARKAFDKLGFSSMFAFCTWELNYSEHQAYLRINVARTARKFPVIWAMIASGNLHLTAVKMEVLGSNHGPFSLRRAHSAFLLFRRALGLELDTMGTFDDH